eukprot:Em0017g438a
MEESKQEREEAEKKMEGAKKEMEEAEKKMEEAEKKMKEAEKKVEEAEKVMEEAKVNLQAAKQEKKTAQEMNDIESTCNRCKYKLKTCEETYNTFRRMWIVCCQKRERYHQIWDTCCSKWLQSYVSNFRSIVTVLKHQKNQSEEASTSKRSSRHANVEIVSAWAELKKKKESPQGNRTTGITEHQYAEKRWKKEVVRFPRSSSDWF